jgi:hypothetical protein
MKCSTNLFKSAVMVTLEEMVREARRLEIIVYEIPGPGSYEHSQIRCIWRSSSILAACRAIKIQRRRTTLSSHMRFEVSLLDFFFETSALSPLFRREHTWVKFPCRPQSCDESSVPSFHITQDVSKVRYG